MKCGNCGVENSESHKYCKECGTILKKSDIKEKSLITVVVLNLLIAGLGFVYLKEYVKGILAFIIVLTFGVLSYLLLGNGYVLGLIALLLVIIWSYDDAIKINKVNGFQ